jgi:hypothetical protein
MTNAEIEWPVYYEDGKKFINIVRGISDQDKKFTPEILYNIACMGIEKLFMAYFIKVGKLPSNHTLQDLVESMKIVREIPAELEAELMHMNGFQEICSIEMYNRVIPTWDDVKTFIRTVNMTESYIQEIIA